MSYKEAMTQAKASYTKKSPVASRKPKAGAINVYNKADDEKRNIVSASSTTAFKKTTLSVKEARALILKLIPVESLSSRAVVKFLAKFDKDASFRSDLLHMNPKDFKETVFTELYRNLKKDVTRLDDQERSLVKQYTILTEREQVDELTAAQKRILERVKDALMEIKAKKAVIAKASAHLSTADSNISADNLTAKILKPKFDLFDVDKIGIANKSIIDYYENLPKYFITRESIGKQPKVVDIANQVLAIQNHFPHINVVSSSVDDPFIEYITNVANSSAMYDDYDIDFDDITDSKDVLDAYGRYHDTHETRNEQRDAVMDAIEKYSDVIDSTGRHDHSSLRILLNKIADIIPSRNPILSKKDVFGLINPRYTDAIKDVYKHVVENSKKSAVQVRKYNKNVDLDYTVDAVDRAAFDKLKDLEVQLDEEYDDDDDEDEDNSSSSASSSSSSSASASASDRPSTLPPLPTSPPPNKSAHLQHPYAPTKRPKTLNDRIAHSALDTHDRRLEPQFNQAADDDMDDSAAGIRKLKGRGKVAFKFLKNK